MPKTWLPPNEPSPTALIALYTATSTRFSIDVRIQGCCSGLAVRYWSEQQPWILTSMLKRVDRRVEQARPGCPGRVVDDLRALVVHLRRELLALNRVVERRRVEIGRAHV